MKIIIVGNGKVGYAIARQLAVEYHDITIVDDDAAALHRADSTLDVMCVEGNGASISVLDAAGVRGADLVCPWPFRIMWRILPIIPCCTAPLPRLWWCCCGSI